MEGVNKCPCPGICTILWCLIQTLRYSNCTNKDTCVEGTATSTLVVSTLHISVTTHNNGSAHNIKPSPSPSFSRLNKVTELLLFDNMLERIPPSLFEMTSLELLNLDRNHLMELPSTVSPDSLAHICHLRQPCAPEARLG